MDPYIDEDGEPLMDPDARDMSPEPYDDLEDDLGDDGGGDWTRDRSPTPVHDAGGKAAAKPRKRLLKKGGGDAPVDDGLDDWGLEDEGAGTAEAEAEAAAAARKGKGSSALRDLARGGAGKEKKEKKRRREDDGRDRGVAREKWGFSGGKASGGGCGGSHRDHDDDGQREIQELWDTIAGGDSE